MACQEQTDNLIKRHEKDNFCQESGTRFLKYFYFITFVICYLIYLVNNFFVGGATVRYILSEASDIVDCG